MFDDCEKTTSILTMLVHINKCQARKKYDYIQCKGGSENK